MNFATGLDGLRRPRVERLHGTVKKQNAKIDTELGRTILDLETLQLQSN